MGIGLLLAALVVGVVGPAYLRRAVDAGSAPHVALGAWLGTGAVFLLLLVAGFFPKPILDMADATATKAMSAVGMQDPAPQEGDR